jgi:hypothetical protein
METLKIKRYRRADRIVEILARLDRRGKDFMDRAIACGGDQAEYNRCVAGTMAAANRCMRLSAYVDDLARPTNRRYA